MGNAVQYAHHRVERVYCENPGIQSGRHLAWGSWRDGASGQRMVPWRPVGGTGWRIRCRPNAGRWLRCSLRIYIHLASVSLSEALSRRERDASNHQIAQYADQRTSPGSLPTPALINDIFEGKVSMDTKPSTQEIRSLSDLSGFTKMSEEQGAETVADFLNDYLCHERDHL